MIPARPSPARPGTGSRYLRWPAGCWALASRPPSRRTWPGAGPTARSERWSRPGRRPASSAPMNSWYGLSEPPGHPDASHQLSSTARVRRAAVRRVPSQLGPLTAGSTAAATPIRALRADDRRISLPGIRLPLSADSKVRAPGPDADNRAAVAAYRLSAQVGNPLSERKLAQMFGRTSRRWARARITEAQRSPLPIQCSNAPTTSRRSGLAAPFTVRNRRCDWCETLPADYGPRTAVSAARLGARRSPNSADAAWQRSDDHEGFARDPGSAAG